MVFVPDSIKIFDSLGTLKYVVDWNSPPVGSVISPPGQYEGEAASIRNSLSALYKYQKSFPSSGMCFTLYPINSSWVSLSYIFTPGKI